MAPLPPVVSGLRDPALPTNYDAAAVADSLTDPDEVTVNLGGVAVVLSPTDFPPSLPLVDHTPVPPFNPATGNARQDALKLLSPVQLALMLDPNEILMRGSETGDGAEAGTMHAFVAGTSMTRAPKAGVRFKKISVQSPEVDQYDSINFSYHSYESSIQRQLGVKTSAEGGVPKVFKFAASYKDTTSSSEGDTKIFLHLQATQLMQKAKIVFSEKDIQLTPEFVDSIKSACETNSGQGNALEILKHLREYGHFVALNTLLGGRMTLLKTKQLERHSEFAAEQANFEAAAAARFVIEGIQFTGSFGAGVASNTTSQSEINNQALTLHRELRGGKMTGGPADDAIVGSDWIDSVGPYTLWRVIGFQEDSLVPTIDFLPEPTRGQCKAILKRYFASHLISTKSDSAGHDDGKEFDPDVTKVKRISKIEVNSEGNLDGLRLTFEEHQPGSGTKLTTTPWFGKDRGVQHTRTIDLLMSTTPGDDQNERLLGIRARVDSKHNIGPAVRALAFETTEKRYPDPGRFYGTNKCDQEVYISAPRIRGLFGRTGAWMHSIGVRYLHLGNSVKVDREYLLTMEEFLFPDGDYGIVTRQ